MNQLASQLQTEANEQQQYRVAQQPYYQPMRDEVETFQAAYQVRMPVMLKGPTGCGKSLSLIHI